MLQQVRGGISPLAHMDTSGLAAASSSMFALTRLAETAQNNGGSYHPHARRENSDSRTLNVYMTASEAAQNLTRKPAEIAMQLLGDKAPTVSAQDLKDNIDNELSQIEARGGHQSRSLQSAVAYLGDVTGAMEYNRSLYRLGDTFENEMWDCEKPVPLIMARWRERVNEVGLAQFLRTELKDASSLFKYPVHVEKALVYDAVLFAIDEFYNTEYVMTPKEIQEVIEAFRTVLSSATIQKHIYDRLYQCLRTTEDANRRFFEYPLSNKDLRNFRLLLLTIDLVPEHFQAFHDPVPSILQDDFQHVGAINALFFFAMHPQVQASGYVDQLIDFLKETAIPTSDQFFERQHKASGMGSPYFGIPIYDSLRNIVKANENPRVQEAIDVMWPDAVKKVDAA